VLDGLTQDSGISSESALARCHVELANYFAAAFLMPYQDIFKEAERTKYDVDRLAASFGVSFEQVCHRLTTLQRKGSEGVGFSPSAAQRIGLCSAMRPKTGVCRLLWGVPLMMPSVSVTPISSI